APGRARDAAPGPARSAALLTVSTSKAAGEGVDEGGPALARLAERLGLDVVARALVADDRGEIEAVLREFVAEGRALVLTTGGTGVGPSDVTPEATSAVIERPIPGLAEAVRAASRPHTPHWALSRGVAGVCGATLIVNLPGSPRAIEQVEPALLAALPHALALIAGERPH
ncbi:MAG TPA: MogA/MoaB family molybdenum cofactor biosynthesis protein, partial [Solirubrobacteraceae bacterium]|nr:MogA/MoaB family molybdenum cofactor biosynthesis protein [Solirubrobacteraceae bacterium]